MADSATLLLSPCLQLLHRFFHCLDQSRYEQLISLFEPDAVWNRQGVELRGHDEIRLALATRSATQRIRHVLSNTFVAVEEGNMARLTSYMTVYRFDNGVPPVGPVTINGPMQMYTVDASVRLTPQRAGIVKLEITPEFRFATNVAVD